ncbi:MAG: NADH-quinone oxidoreductase subunit J [bacterium]|nr:NADH-quinone oxidoreductase subunit J [bacterium]
MMESQPSIAFWLLAIVILTSGFMVVSLRNIFHCALNLIMCLFSVAGIFILLGAEFLAAAQVLIYVGAVAILMIFAIMLTSEISNRRIVQTTENKSVALFISVIFALSSVFLIMGTKIWRMSDQALPENNTLTIGKYLMTEYMLPFEVVSVLLLAAMIGAIVLARKEAS